MPAIPLSPILHHLIIRHQHLIQSYRRHHSRTSYRSPNVGGEQPSPACLGNSLPPALPNGPFTPPLHTGERREASTGIGEGKKHTTIVCLHSTHSCFLNTPPRYYYWMGSISQVHFTKSVRTGSLFAASHTGTFGLR